MKMQPPNSTGHIDTLSSSPVHEAEPAPAPPAAFDLIIPADDVVPLPFIFTSPHSGDYYPPEFIAAARLAPLPLRLSEDAFVDQLFMAAPALGAPLLRARYARVYLDPNREPYELDPGMFDGPLPAHVNTTSARVAGGLGTVPRVVSRGSEIHGCKIPFSEAEQRIRKIYFPYHRSLRNCIQRTQEIFGACVIIDCHSMPSQGGPMDRDNDAPRPDVVLGDRYATSCDPAISRTVQQALQNRGLTVTRNAPYAGGFTTYHYGRPETGVHVLQIEINRGLYMNEERIEPSDGFAPLQETITHMIGQLMALDVAGLRPAA